MSESSDIVPAEVLEHFNLALDRTQTQIEDVTREIDEKIGIFEEVQRAVKNLGAVFENITVVVDDSQRGIKEAKRDAQDVMIAVLRLRECLKNFTGNEEL